MSGTIQFYANISALGADQFESLLQLDVGDILGIKGVPFRTKRGELSIKISSFELLTKAMLPLPEKYHGLQDKEQRYRMRYVDLIANPSVRDVFKTRSEVIFGMRQYLAEQGFLEVETPVLHHVYGGAAAQPFQTHHNELGQDLYLRIALELHLKRMMVGGFEKIYEIGRVFRNEGVSYKHNPEYTLLELYQAYVDYQDILVLTETLIAHLVKQVHSSYQIQYQDQTLDFTPPFRRLTLSDAVKMYAGVDLEDEASMRDKAKSVGIESAETLSKGHLITELYDKVVESQLIQPTVIMDYPWETSPLAKRKRDNPELVERFELIVNGMEVANAFSELNDPVDQQARFEDQIKAKADGWEDAHEMDEDFVTSLKYGMPPTGGVGIGIDRIVMLLTNSASIRDVICFPHMKLK